MKMKKILAAVAASAVTASAFAAMSISTYAAEKTIAYKESAGSLNVGNDGVSVRRNIYNVWGNTVTDIDNNTAVTDHITVNFTVSGIGTDSLKTNEDGSTEQLIAWICGDAGTNDCWKDGDNGYAPVNINGDGDYTATWTLSEASGSIECLILQSNINFYAYFTDDYTGDKTVDASGVKLTINSISTGEEEEDPAKTTTADGGDTDERSTTEAVTTVADSNDNNGATTVADGGATTAAATTTTTVAATTTTKAGATTAAGATTTSAGGTTTAAGTVPQTGDTGAGIAVAVAATGVAVAFAMRKKNN